jgi:hypothetical protein
MLSCNIYQFNRNKYRTKTEDHRKQKTASVYQSFRTHANSEFHNSSQLLPEVIFCTSTAVTTDMAVLTGVSSISDREEAVSHQQTIIPSLLKKFITCRMT